MQPFRMQGILIFCLIFVSTVIEGQLDFDCRRNNVTCFGDTPTVDHCSLQTGDCTCPNGTEGYNCGLDTSHKVTCSANQCLNGATCITGGGCYCNSDTYGPTCQNFRVAVWCTDVKMFISVNPEVGNFSGTLFVSAEDIPGARDTHECSMLGNKFAVDTAAPEWVTVANGGVDLTGLEGFFLQIDHNTTANGGTSKCGSAVVTQGENGSKSYTRRVAIEYNSNLLTSLDQMLNVVCTLQNTSDLKTNSSFTAVIANNNYQQVNISDTIEPVSFEILDAANKPITSEIHLGDQVNLKFKVIFPTYTALKVKECNATNGQVGAAQINFLKNDCPVLEWGALFRGDILVPVNSTEISSTVPLSAFRFNGNISTVMFVCSLQLCTETNAAACVRSPCGAASSNTPGVTQAPTPAPPDNTPQPTTAAPTEAPAPSPVPGRRKRESGLQEQAQLSKSVQVLAGDETSSVQGTPSTASDKDCMEHNEVVVIIVTFSVALALMLILIVVLVIQRLRSRVKVIDASDVASADSQSHYSLPRLSGANF